MSQEFQQRADEFRDVFNRLVAETQKVIVGNDDIIEGVLSALFAGGHVLLEGVPGLGKTMLVRTLGDVLDLPFNRVQFTPDLMPADIVGTNVVQEDPDSGRRSLQFEAGPIFTSLVLADEINRATPKTQSAMLECMQEKQVTVGGRRYPMTLPFFVMATQNPLEMEGTYPLPEAQMDRFLYKLLVPFPRRGELAEILERTTRRTHPAAGKVIGRDAVLEWMDFVREVEVAPHVQDYAVRIVLATHPESDFATEMARRFVRFGSSPRGAQGLILGAKIKALRAGRANIAFADISAMVPAVLRHRIGLNFEADAEGISADAILADVLEKVDRESTDFAGTNG